MFFARIRERITGVITLAVLSVGMFACGAVMAFIISPQQAIEWRRLDNLPVTTAGSFESAPEGTEMIVTGTLNDNTVFDNGLVMYEVDEWTVDRDTDSEGDVTYDGTWHSVEAQYPQLNMDLDGSPVTILAVSNLRLFGALQESMVDGNGQYSDSYNGQNLRDGARRTRGVADGALVTVLGTRTSSGGISPDRLFVGDRTQMIEALQDQARGLFIGGIGAMICAPVFFVLGVVAVVLGRRT